MSRGLHRWRPGDPLRAGWLNEPRRAARESTVRADGFTLSGRIGGRRPILSDHGAEPIVGLLSGSTSPYSFTSQVETDSAGTWSTGPLAGTAYEVNGVGGLNATRHRLYPTRFGGWRFQSVRHGSGHTACGCSGLPDTLSLTYRYLLAGGAGFTTKTFDVDWDPGSVTIYPSGGGSYSVTGYWVSGCVDLSDSLNCAAGTVCIRVCSGKFYFFCVPGGGSDFAVALDLWTDVGCAGTRYNGGFIDCRAPLAGPVDYGDHNTATCSPFYWRYPSIGTATYQVSP